MFHMKYWAISLVMFLITTTSEGQVRSQRPAFRGQEVFRGVTPALRPSPAVRSPLRSFPRQSIVIAPQVPFYSYYPYASYYQAPYYSQPAYSTPDQSSNTEEINSLIDQIQRLTNEVQRLQAELAATRAQQAQPSSLQVTPPTPAKPVIPTVLIFQDGHQIEIQGYAIVGPTLWTTYKEGAWKIALSDLNLEATRQENLKRGINFLPQK
jgi:hypothetical protein